MMHAAWSLLLFLPGFVSAQDRVHRDRDRLFSLPIPGGWKVHTSPVPNVGTVTSLSAQPGGPEDQPGVEVVTVPRQGSLVSMSLDQASQALFSLVLGPIQQGGEVFNSRLGSGHLDGREARTCELNYRGPNQATPMRALMAVVLTDTHAVLVARSAPQGDGAGWRKCEEALAGFRLGVSAPAAAARVGVAGSGCLDAKGMARTVAHVRQGLRPSSADQVLVEGNPPLTHESVASFVQVVNLAFGIQMTEGEFEMTRQRFVTFYGKGKPEDRAVLALGGKRLLDQMTQGSAQDQARGRQEVRTVMEGRLAAGAQAGIAWAQALHEAIQRRSQVLTQSQAQPQGNPGGQYKKTFTAADLEAALEMLYFMWVASGRNAALVTPEAVAQIRQSLVLQFASFHPNLQMVLCNAEKAYAEMRMAYQQADPGTRAMLAQQYAQSLDSLGLTVPRPNSGGAWSNVRGATESSTRAELMMSYAGLAATSTSFSGRTVSY